MFYINQRYIYLHQNYYKSPLWVHYHKKYRGRWNEFYSTTWLKFALSIEVWLIMIFSRNYWSDLLHSLINSSYHCTRRRKKGLLGYANLINKNYVGKGKIPNWHVIAFMLFLLSKYQLKSISVWFRVLDMALNDFVGQTITTNKSWRLFKVINMPWYNTYPDLFGGHHF